MVDGAERAERELAAVGLVVDRQRRVRAEVPKVRRLAPARRRGAEHELAVPQLRGGERELEGPVAPRANERPLAVAVAQPQALRGEAWVPGGEDAAPARRDVAEVPAGLPSTSVNNFSSFSHPKSLENRHSRRTLMPVSYTHLTLPTIYSV